MPFVMIKRPPPAAKIYKTYRDEVRKDLRELGKRGETAYRRVVRNWSGRSRADFKSRVESGAQRTRLSINPTGNSHQLFIWKLVNTTGRKPGIIRPKASNPWGRLFFPWGGPGSYQSKTDHSPARFGGPGTVLNAKLTVAAGVRHPGFRPRRFDKALNPDIEKEALKAIRTAGRRGIRKGKRSR